ncbi:hypothetical protein GCM10010276_72800 [Streptomyces longisporus]|uniref:Uncharacterized protein n=1 Tax=Streptomyces longisporus TaxID=1948 RepID=A0ABP6ABX9_STRLO
MRDRDHFTYVPVQVMSDSHEAPADCPATLRPWRGAPGEDQAVGSEVYGKRGPLEQPGVLVVEEPSVSKRMR